MSSLTSQAIDSVAGKFYRPTDGCPPEDRLLKEEHYIKVGGEVTCFSKDIKTLLDVEIFHRVTNNTGAASKGTFPLKS